MSLNPQPLYQLADWVARQGSIGSWGFRRLGWMMTGWAPCWTGGGASGRHLEHDHRPCAREFQPDLEWLHSDTTSVYFEGRYEDDEGRPSRPNMRRYWSKATIRMAGRRSPVCVELITSKRVPLWYQPWDGNQRDDGVYLADMTALRATGLLPENVVLIGDREAVQSRRDVGVLPHQPVLPGGASLDRHRQGHLGADLAGAAAGRVGLDGGGIRHTQCRR